MATDEARVLAAAGIFGEHAWGGGIAAVAEESTEALAPAVARLVAEGWLRPVTPSRFPGEVEYALDARVAEAAVAWLPEPARRRANTQAGRWLDAAGELDTAVVAVHLAHGDTPEEAIPWCAEAARVAKADGRLDAVLGWSQRAIDLGADPDTKLAMRLLQLEAHDGRGETDDAERCAQEMWALARPGSALKYRAGAALAVLAMRRQRPEALAELGPALQVALQGPSEDNAEAALAPALFPILYAGLFPLGELLLGRLEAIQAAGTHPDADFPARVSIARAIWANFNGDSERYLEESLRAAEAFATLGDARRELSSRVNAGVAYVLLGDADAAVEALQRAASRADAEGLRRLGMAARSNLGNALLLARRPDDARATLERALAESEALADARLVATGQVYLARVLRAGGALDEARALVERALPQLGPSASLWVLACALHADLQMIRGEFDAALASVRSGFEVLDRMRSVEEGEAELRLAQVDAFDAIGDGEAARAALQRARERLLARAGRIQDPARRARFLGRIPAHARTLVLGR
ncbi:MAG: hypothetical protein HY909_22445 [Deltaproteobacteria bacterium]|nr:hypothetical protein [Deltaproteobacteria bacterium]